MTNVELDFLRFAYSCLNTDAKIRIQKLSPFEPPECYTFPICERCTNKSASFECQECGKGLCVFCMQFCRNQHVSLCPDKFDFCSSCAECACILCRVYAPKRICDLCLELHERSFVCKNCFDNSELGECLYCDHKLDPTTQFRIDKKRKRKDTT